MTSAYSPVSSSSSIRGSKATPRRLIMAAIDKGGVGKSFFCIQLVSWLKARRVDFAAYDPDHANSTLSRFVPEAVFLDSRHPENLDILIERLNDTPIVLVDGMVGRQGMIFDWIEETRLPALRHELGFSITLALPIEDDKDSVHQAGEVAERLGKDVDLLVIKNQKMRSSFRIYENSRAREKLLACGAREITLKRLDDALAEELQSKSLTIDAALSSRSLFLIDHQRLLQYQRDLFAELDSVADILIQ